MEPWEARHVEGEKVWSEFHLVHQEGAVARGAGEKGSEWSQAVGNAEQ